MQNTHKHIIKYKKYRNIGLLFTVDANSYKFFIIQNIYGRIRIKSAGSTMPSEPYHWIMAQPIKHH